MGELNFGGDVADSIDMRRGRAHVVVDVDSASGGDTHSSGVETDSFDVGTKSDADEGPRGLRGGGCSVSAGVADGDVLAVVGDAVHAGRRVNRYPAAPVVALQVLVRRRHPR